MTESFMMVASTPSHIGTDSDMATSTEHYIHSRLKSTLPSGPKEIATAYSGIMEGNSLRRIASVNAEARTKLFYTPISPVKSYHNGCVGLLESTITNGTCSHTIDEVPSHTNDALHNSPADVDQNTTTSSGNSPVTPATSPPSIFLQSSASSTLSPTKLSNSSYILKDSRVQVVDVLKKKHHPQASMTTPTAKRLQHTMPRVSPPLGPLGYVKRLAAVNARACVHAIMTGREETVKHKDVNVIQTRSLSQLHGGSTEQTGNSNQNNGKNNKDEGDVRTRDGLTQQPVNSSLGLSSQAASTDLECTESIPSSNEDEPEKVGKLPSIIIPLIIPKTMQEVSNICSGAKENQPQDKKRSQKGDNGWTTIGDPIKTIDIRLGGGTKDIINRKYYKGIKRKNENVFVRDSIVVRSGRKRFNSPYFAKIASIWQESDGIMLTVFWYYRPEDVDENTAKLFHDYELMGSQHHDDIGVACIDDKCHVLGLNPFCRYLANEKRNEIGLQYQCPVPPFDKNSSTVIGTTAIENESFVYFCHRGYNHIARKVMKIAK